MDLKTYVLGLRGPERDDLAKRCGTSRGHLMNIAYGCKPCAPELAVEIDRETGGKVTCEELRPDVDWQHLRRSGKRRGIRVAGAHGATA